MGKLELNSTMLELKKSEGAGFKTFALCYLLYIAVMVIFQIIFRGSQQIVGVLAGYFAAMPVLCRLACLSCYAGNCVGD